MDKKQGIIITFIIAVFNNERYLPKAIQSILNQWEPGVEIIVVDDGSTDDSGRIADGFVAKNNAVKVIHQNNQWIYASFNNGIKASSGEYIYILNSDDILLDGAVGLLLRKLKEYSYPDVIWTRIITSECDENQNIVREINYYTKRDIEEELYVRGEEVHEIWPKLMRSWLCYDQANLYKRNLAVLYPFREDYYTSDVYFNLSIADSINSCVVLKEPVYLYLRYKSSKGNAAAMYYQYEHAMRNELFRRYLELYRKWRLKEEDYKEVLVDFRMKSITGAIKRLSTPNCNLSTEEKIKKVLIEYTDDEMLNCVNWGNRRIELESRILNGLASMLKNEKLPKDSEMGFVYSLIENLPEKWSQDVDLDKIETDKIKMAVYNPWNPAHIGEKYYKLANTEK